MSMVIAVMDGRCPSSYNLRGLVARASAADSNDNLVSFAPLQFESPIGQFLEQIANTHPHLLLATIGQQLENLWTIKDA
ncbi:hypothetical protein Fmac_002869 [Flemingia macrophylla]|uniref:Uncharacterized protein n=1 Tax=Flemingia macrophylla TaxID=520843 RepID=A0ABD1NL49_9FABA